VFCVTLVPFPTTVHGKMVSHPYQDEYQREISEPLEGTSILYKGVLNIEPGNHVDTAPLVIEKKTTILMVI